MDFLCDWMRGITVAAIILSLADSLMPDGAVKKIGKLTGGLLLMIVVLRPFLSLDYETLAGSIANYKFEVQQHGAQVEVINTRLKKLIIEDRTGAYIQDKAGQLGLECTVEVDCRVKDDELIFPAAVVVYGDLTENQVSQLSRLIESEIAIPKDMQRFERTKMP